MERREFLRLAQPREETDDPVEEDRRQDETKQANHVEPDKQRGIKLIAKRDQPPGSRDG